MTARDGTYGDLHGDGREVDPIAGSFERVPAGVYWSREAGNFYNERTHCGMGVSFYYKWKHRKDEFPYATTTSPGIDIHMDKAVRPV